MTLVYDLPPFLHCSLTVPDEAVRGLYFNDVNWIICASDPTTNAISQYRVPGILAMKAAEELELKRKLDRTDGKAFQAWLLKREFLRVDRITDDARASQFPPHSRMAPRPSMDRPAPFAETAPAQPAPSPVEDLNPADKPHLLAHPAPDLLM